MSKWSTKPTESNATVKMVEDIKVDQVRTTLYLDSIKLKRLKLLCIEKETSMSAVVNQLISEYLQNNLEA